jgi:hypothetical protein
MWLAKTTKTLTIIIFIAFKNNKKEVYHPPFNKVNNISLSL